MYNETFVISRLRRSVVQYFLVKHSLIISKIVMNFNLYVIKYKKIYKNDILTVLYTFVLGFHLRLFYK